MTNKRSIWILLGFAALFLVAKQVLNAPVGGQVEAEQGGLWGAEVSSSVDAELQRANGDGRYWDLSGLAGARARFRFSQSERKVRAEWSKKGCVSQAAADFEVRFIPTGLGAVSDRVLCVFGVDEDSHDFIVDELWFEGPAAASVDAEGDCHVGPVNLKSTLTLWRGARDEFHGLTSPRFVLLNRADANLLFVVFASGSVQSLNRSTGEAVTVASPIEGARPFVPTLGFPGFDHAYSKTHKEFGHIYVLRSSATPGPLLVLEDHDRDGSLDVFHEVSPAEWTELYARASFYE